MSLEKSVAEQVLYDPVLSARPLPLRARFYPLGFPLGLERNSADVMQAASEGWGLFQQAFDEPPLRIGLGVLKSESRKIPPPSKFFSREHLLSITADTENVVVMDFNQGYALGWVTPAVAANHPVLRYRFLLGAMHPLVVHRAPASLHCSFLAPDGRRVSPF